MAYLPGPGPVLVPDVYAQPQPTWGYQQPMQQAYVSDQQPLDCRSLSTYQNEAMQFDAYPQ